MLAVLTLAWRFTLVHPASLVSAWAVIAADRAQQERNGVGDFQTLAKDELRKVRALSNAKFDDAQKELGDACKSDVGSQALRLTLAPLGWVAGNFQAAKDEKNVVTQVIHALSGVGIQAIAEQGALGGDNSDARKLLEPVIGGPHGAIQQGIGDAGRAVSKGAGDAVRALNPGNWRF
jgi:hypothetical protein